MACDGRFWIDMTTDGVSKSEFVVQDTQVIARFPVNVDEAIKPAKQ